MTIPKILHQIWVGNKPIPGLHLKWINKFKELHPDWQFYFWDDSNGSSAASCGGGSASSCGGGGD